MEFIIIIYIMHPPYLNIIFSWLNFNFKGTDQMGFVNESYPN